MANYKKGWHHSPETKRKISEAQLGEKSNNWKGGRSIDAHGYVRVTISPDSPFAPMAHKTRARLRARDITEHRLVMAQHLGRCLEPWECVHHKNGIRSDNRIENLELIPLRKEHIPSANMQRYIEQVQREAYERGKSETLEALKAEGVYCWLDLFSFRGCNRGEVPSEFAPQIGPGSFGKRGDRGWLHFIPDEEGEGVLRPEKGWKPYPEKYCKSVFEEE